MANTVTLTELRSLARLYADHRPGGADAFIDDDEYTVLINSAIREVYDRLVAAGGQHYYFAETTFALTGASTPLPADFLFLYDWSIVWGPKDIESIPDFMTREQSELENYNWWGRRAPKGYQIQGSNLRIVPTPTGSPLTRLQYCPTFTDLVNPADTFDGVNGWEKAVALGAAVEARIIAEDEYRGLKMRWEEQMKRIDEMAARRAMYAPKRVQDVVPEGYMDNLRSARLRNLPRS